MKKSWTIKEYNELISKKLSFCMDHLNDEQQKKFLILLCTAKTKQGYIQILNAMYERLQQL